MSGECSVNESSDSRLTGGQDLAVADAKKNRTVTQYKRDYRARKKLERLQMLANPVNTESSTNVYHFMRSVVNSRLHGGQYDTSSPSTSTGLKQKTAQYYREYRARKKHKVQNTNIAGREVCKQQTLAEYKRDYRARKKREAEQRLLGDRKPPMTGGPSETVSLPDTAGCSETAGPSTSGVVVSKNTRPKRSRAHYQREYRARKKALYEAQEKGSQDYLTINVENNNFGLACFFCDRLCFQQDLASLPPNIDQELLDRIVPDAQRQNITSCQACLWSLRRNRLPTYAVYNGFKYSIVPDGSPPLDVITERLISVETCSWSIRGIRTDYKRTCERRYDGQTLTT